MEAYKITGEASHKDGHLSLGDSACGNCLRLDFFKKVCAIALIFTYDK